MNNSFGDIFRLTSFGESHGPAVGGVIDGMPSGIRIDFDALREAMRRRRPGSSAFVSGRCEADEVEVLSGVFNGITTGTPIGFIVRNTDSRSADYENLKDCYRPSHADYTFEAKFGADCRDYRGGGRASARETVARVVAGEFARQALAGYGIDVRAFTLAIGGISIPFPEEMPSRRAVEASVVKSPDPDAARLMMEEIEKVRREGDTLGGIVGCIVSGCRPGLGDPVFSKLQGALAAAMMSIGAAKGFDYGMGFDGASRRGSEMADIFEPTASGAIPSTFTNHSGGIQGGITNGQPVWFRVAFKPVATMMRPMDTIDRNGCKRVLEPRGRHDVCVVPRAVAVVEAMTWMVMLDVVLKQKAYENF